MSRNEVKEGRLADFIQRAVATAIERDLKDPALRSVTITEAKVSPDFHIAYVFWISQNREEAAKALEKAQKQIDSAFEQACVEKAAENTTVDMPKALVEAELDTQMERFAYQLQMSGYSMDQYAKMMGGDMSTMRNAFRPQAEKQAKLSVTLEKIVETEGLTVTDEEIEAECEALAKQYELEVAKIKEMVPMNELTESLKVRKATKLIVDSAVAVAPKAE